MAENDLNRMPPVIAECQGCANEEEDGVVMKKCSACKNSFYCSQECQQRDWRKQHKFECSLLPIGSLAYIEPVNEKHYAEIEDEVFRVCEVLQKWMDAYEPHHTENNIRVLDRAALPEDKLIKHLKLAAPYSASAYKCLPKDHERFPYRLPLIFIFRLLLIHLATPSPKNPLDEVKKLEEFVDNVRPSCPWPMWAPKYVCRPGDLSPGEYELLPQFMLVYTRALWSGGAAKDGEVRDTNEEERRKTAFNKRFIYLSVLIKRRYTTE